MRKVIILIMGILVIGAALSCGGGGGDPVRALANCTWKMHGEYLKNQEGFRSASDFRAYLQYELDAGNIDMDDIREGLEDCRAAS